MQHFRILCILCAGLMLSACLPVTSKTPLGTTAPSQAEDPELRGNWNATSPRKEEKGTAYFHFLPTKNPDDGPKMSAILFTPDKDGQLSEWTVYAATPVRLGKHRYLNARIVSENGQASSAEDESKIIPVLYTIRKGTLSLYILNEEKTAAAIKAGRIAGEVKEEAQYKTMDVKLTADGPALDAFFATDEGAALFSEKVFVPFRRIP